MELQTILFSEADTTNWSDKLITITEVFNDTITTYHQNNLRKRCNERLLKKLELTMKENEQK